MTDNEKIINRLKSLLILMYRFERRNKIQFMFIDSHGKPWGIDEVNEWLVELDHPIHRPQRNIMLKANEIWRSVKNAG